MASKATVLRAELAISDMNRHYYSSHTLTVAQHPSETPERVMMRLVAFALHASETLSFTRGLSTEDEPDVWDKDLTDHITLWIDLGQPDEKRIRKACGRADRVWLYTYQTRNAGPWWEKMQSSVARFETLSVAAIDVRDGVLDALFARNMTLQCTIQDETVTLYSDAGEVTLTVTVWKEAVARGG